MTTGEGIVWAAILGLVALGARYITKSKRWKLVGRILGGLVTLGAIIGGGYFFYTLYQNRPVPQNGMFGIDLGTSDIDVKLALGKPSYEFTSTNVAGEEILSYLFGQYTGSTIIDKIVRFKSKNEKRSVYMICDLSPYDGLFGINIYTNEDKVLKKLGTPSGEDINSDGLKKMITYNELNVAIEVEKKKVSSICVTDNDLATYSKTTIGEGGKLRFLDDFKVER